MVKERLLEAGAVRFLIDGFARTTMEGVAGQAGVSKKTLYRHFESKVALYEAVVRYVATPAAPPFQGGGDEEGSLERTLEALASWIYDLVTDPRMFALIRTVIGESAAFPELSRLMFVRGYEDGQGPFAPAVSVFERAIERGELHLPNATMAAEIFASMAYGGLRLLMMPRESQTARKVWVSTVVRIFLDGARTRAETGLERGQGPDLRSSRL